MTDKNNQSPSSSLTNEDLGHPLFLHHFDHLGMVLVSQPLNEENYNTWSRAMTMALSAKNKIGFVDGSISKPSKTSDAELKQWTRCNNMVKSWLLNSLSKEISQSVINCDLAYEIWTDLKERFAQVNGPHLYQIESGIHNLFEDTMSAATYFTKLKGLWDELASLYSIPTCSCGAMKSVLQYQQNQKTLKFLMGLNDSYAAIRGQILLNDPLPPVNRAYSLVLQEERQRAISSHKNMLPEAATLATKKIPYTQEGREYKNMGKKRERPKCEHCGWVGHTIDKCYHIHGFPSDYQKRKPDSKGNVNHVSSTLVEKKEQSVGFPFTPDQCQQLLNLLNYANKPSVMAHHVGNTSTMSNLSGKNICLSSYFKNTSWILDSGATDHMVCSSSYLTSLLPVQGQSVKLPNGSLAPVTHIGSITFSSYLIFTNVLCVPSFHFNLISINKLSQNANCSIIFSANSCVIQDQRSRMMIGIGAERDGLYFFHQT